MLLENYEILFVPLGGVIFLILLVVIILLLKRTGKEYEYPFKAKPVLSDVERRLFLSLRAVTPAGTALLAKVRLADFLKVEAGREDFMSHFPKISQKHSDFLLIDLETASPILAIELDDKTHRTSSRTVLSDDFKDSAYHAARLAILRLPVQKKYDREELAAAMKDALMNLQANE